MRRAVNRKFEMTQKYIRTAEAVGEVIGAVFPPLPGSLAAGRYRQEYRPSDAQLIGTIAGATRQPRASHARPDADRQVQTTLRAAGCAFSL